MVGKSLGNLGRIGAMTCMTFRSARVPAVAFAVVSAVLVSTVCIASAQESERGGFLDNLFGGSERAAPQQQGRAAQATDSELIVRLDRLEAQVRQLTGAIEQLQYRNQRLEAALQEMHGGPPRTTHGQPSYQTPYHPAGSSPPPAPGRRGDAFDPTQHPNAPGAPHQLGTTTASGPLSRPPAATEQPVSAPGPYEHSAPLDLSTMAGAAGSDRSLSPGGGPGPGPQSPRQPASSPHGPQLATLPPSNSPKDNFDLAYGYMLRRDYGQAENSFRAFLQKFPNDRLTPDAQYWLGESLFQSKQYRDAAEAFLTVSTKYENTPKAPESLLRLGQSLAALGEKEAACASLGEVLRKYPRASVAVKQGVEREQKRAHC
jgi:tol-pal system protein YbgF